MKKLLLALLLLWPSVAWGQASFTFKDAAGATQTVKSFNCTAICPLTVLTDVNGAAIYAAAGSANTNVLSVQGIAAMTPLLTTTTLNAETTKVIGTVRTLGNVGATLDFIGQNGASPANAFLIGGQFNTAPTTIVSGNASPLQLDSAGNLKINAAVGGGTSSTFAATFPAVGTAIGAKSGLNMVNLVADGSNNLQVNCAVGCSGGTFNNNADGVATSATNGQAAAWLYGFNGTTWDRLRADTTNGLWVNVKAATGLTQGSSTSGQTGSLVMGQTGGSTGGLTQPFIQCNLSATYDAATSGATQMVALAASQSIYVCGFSITVGGTATNVKLVYGTGSNCATGTTNMTPAFQLAINGGIVDGAPFWRGLKTASANALCINASAANAVQAIVYYAQF